jgi:hypothetical protein
MTGTRSGNAPDDRETGSWATETLPLAVRKEMLERELHKLGFRKAGTQGSESHGGGSGQQQQGGTGHPSADTDSDTHGD